MRQNLQDGVRPLGRGRAVCLSFEATDASMAPRIEPGEIVITQNRRWQRPCPTFKDDLAVVKTSDGLTLVRTVRPGSAPGLFDLIALNGPDKIDVRLAWVLPVAAIGQPSYWQWAKAL